MHVGRVCGIDILLLAKNVRRFVVALLVGWLATGSAHAATTLSREATAAEQTLFDAALCAQKAPSSIGQEPVCTGHPKFPTFVLYGEFTRADANEVVVSYLNPNNERFGGGALFRRTASGWTFVRWTDAWLHCATTPGTGPQHVVCAFYGGNQGEFVSRVDEEWLTSSSTGTRTLLEADDMRRATVSFNDPRAVAGCESVPKGAGFLESVDPLTLQAAPAPDFASVKITYFTAAHIAASCSGTKPKAVPETNGLARFRWDGHAVRVTLPLPLVR